MTNQQNQSAESSSHSITPDGGIVKIPLVSRPETNIIEFKRGLNALLHYTCHAYIIPSLEPKPSQRPHSSCDGKCAHSSKEAIDKKIQLIDSLLNPLPMGKSVGPDERHKPVRTLIADSRKRDLKPFELRMGYKFTVQAFEICIKSMKVGEKARFLCMPEYVDGLIQLETLMRQDYANKDRKESGLALLNFSGCTAHMSPEIIELNQGLEEAIGVPVEFEFELIDVVEVDKIDKEVWEMDLDEKYCLIPIFKDQGSKLYKEQKYAQALKVYEKCLTIIQSLLSNEKIIDLKRDGKNKVDGCAVQIDQLDCWTLQSRLNFAACLLKLKDYARVILVCNQVLVGDKNNIKGIYRRCQAYIAIGRDLELAQADLDSLVGLKAAETSILERDLQHKVKIYKKKERSMYGGKLN